MPLDPAFADAEALERHRDAVRRLARGLVRDYDADDVAQETVELGTFALGRYEVTRIEFAAAGLEPQPCGISVYGYSKFDSYGYAGAPTTLSQP